MSISSPGTCKRSADRGNPASSWLYVRAGVAIPNAYPGRCVICGVHLAAGQGAAQRSASSRRYVCFC